MTPDPDPETTDPRKEPDMTPTPAPNGYADQEPPTGIPDIFRGPNPTPGITQEWVDDLLDRRPAAPEPDPAAVLAVAAAERENDLLNRASTAHTEGWHHAITEAAGILDRLYRNPPTSRHLPGLAAATAAVLDLAGRPPTPSPHRLAVAVVPGHEAPELGVTCTAPVGAACRLTCHGAVEGTCDEVEGTCNGVCECDGGLVDGGTCLAVSWLDGDPDYIFAAYVGPARPFTSAPIACRWDPKEAGWSWMYAQDLPDGVTVQEWARATP